jgi:hypothetical protein
VLRKILSKAFDQYVFDRVDNTLTTASTSNVEYSKAEKEVKFVLAQLIAIAKELEEQRPELLSLVMDFDSAATLESGLAAEIAYRAGIWDSLCIRQEFIRLMREQTSYK